MEGELTSKLKEQITQIDSLKSLRPWSPTYEVWKATTSELLQRLLGDEYVRLMRGQQSVVIVVDDEEEDRQNYLKELKRMSEFLDSVITAHSRLGRLRGTHKEKTASAEEVFESKQPDAIGNAVWLWRLPEKIDRAASRYIKSNFLRRLVVLVLFIVVVLILGEGYVHAFRDTGYFQYQPQELAYAEKSPEASTTIQVLFQGDITNISSSPRYLKNLEAVIWKNEILGSTWNDGLDSADVNEVYEVKGATDTPVTMPLYFEANESQTLQWRFTIDASDPDVRSVLSEEECQGVFCWNKGQLWILMEDSRGNLFNQYGYLKSQQVMDDWWILPDYRKPTDMLTAVTGLSYDIVNWKIREFLPWLN